MVLLAVLETFAKIISETAFYVENISKNTIEIEIDRVFFFNRNCSPKLQKTFTTFEFAISNQILELAICNSIYGMKLSSYIDQTYENIDFFQSTIYLISMNDTNRFCILRIF
jgi:hypothetical protein